MSPHSSRKMFAKKTGNYDLALQGPRSGPPILMAGGFSSGAGSCDAAFKGSLGRCALASLDGLAT